METRQKASAAPATRRRRFSIQVLELEVSHPYCFRALPSAGTQHSRASQAASDAITHSSPITKLLLRRGKCLSGRSQDKAGECRNSTEGNSALSPSGRAVIEVLPNISRKMMDMLHILVCLMKQTWFCPTWERIADAALIFFLSALVMYIEKYTHILHICAALMSDNKYVKSNMTTNTKEKKRTKHYFTADYTELHFSAGSEAF